GGPGGRADAFSGGADVAPGAPQVAERLSTAEAPPPSLAPGEGGPVWSRSGLAARVEVIRTHAGRTVVWVRTLTEAADPAARRGIRHTDVPEGPDDIVGVVVHANSRGAHVGGRWVPGDALAAVVMDRLGVAEGEPAPTVVLLSCQATNAVAHEFDQTY